MILLRLNQERDEALILAEALCPGPDSTCLKTPLVRRGMKRRYLCFSYDNDIRNRDNFPLLVSHVNGVGTRVSPPTYLFHGADSDKFPRLTIITDITVQKRAVDDALLIVTEAIWNAADAAIPTTSDSTRKLCKPWWNSSCQQTKKEQRRALSIFRRYPTTEYIIAFRSAKVLVRRIHVKIRDNLG
ncbi:hypothetical protein TNCV_1757651 [Trichonephila clavipes]|nr:hypothetical protein TNCV_1757651 [Trichonephila clavipes]